MKPILEIQSISKRYRIQHLAGGYLSLRERMVNALKFEKNNMEDFWALKDVSFEVQPGESIGIIGRNGAGKSTLLKILSKITPPTTGRIVSRGRIASLLEVGTGFHPELTGRENIFFNGSLLGMKRKEIDKKFDEIVDFSGTEKFLDTPLKHYSSGMQLRLAFSVAAFLEPEILIIDEVLAVGDAEFQKKCLGKMEDVSKSGRTILFVSHNMAAVREMCQKTILMNKGRCELIGPSTDVIEMYLKNGMVQACYEGERKQDSPYIEKVYSINSSGELGTSFLNEDEIAVCIKTQNTGSVINLSLGLALRDRLGNKLFTTTKKYLAEQGDKLHTVTIPGKLLLSGNYSVDVAIFIPNGSVYDYARECIAIRVDDFESDMAVYSSADIGVINVPCTWT
ncbi:MAG: ABC transporter ATP-binding protein [Cyclobacteriaceae bacterium]|nr:ABC transporter ATP-binding protein [Cyclobacteriaceae bacterium]